MGERPHAPRPDHRKGRQPVGLYVAAAAILVLIAAGVVWAVGALRGAVAPPKPPSRTAVTTSAPSSVAPSAAPLPGSAAAESAAAVEAAALPYPNPPAVTPETIRRATPSRRLVALTFDDGGTFDTRILRLLEQKNVRCTTFLLGQTVKGQGSIVRRLNSDGFEIANRTWDGKLLTKLTDAQVRDELKRAQDAISAVTGNQAPYLRPPEGATDSRIQRLAAAAGYRVVLWNRSSGDLASAATSAAIADNVTSGIKPGDIVLLHWGGKHTYEAMQRILPALESAGLTPVTLSELLKYSSTAAGAKAPQGKGGAGTPAPPPASAEATAKRAPGVAAAPGRTAAVPSSAAPSPGSAAAPGTGKAAAPPGEAAPPFEK